MKGLIASFAAGAMTSPALATTDLTGTVVATLTISFKTAPAKGSTVSCSLALLGSDTLQPSESQSISANVTNSTAVCKLTVPYNWRLDSATSTMSIVYSASGPIQTSSGTAEIITMPANGATTTVAVAITQ